MSAAVAAKLAELGVSGGPRALGVAIGSPFPARGADGVVRLLVWRERERATSTVRECEADS